MRTKSKLSILAGLVLLVLIIAPLQSASAAPPKEWDKAFGGESFEYAYCAQQTADGGYITAGVTASSGAGNYDAWLIKTNSSGDKEWDQTFGGTNNDWGLSVQQTADGGYVLAGITYSYGAGDSDAWLIKTDSSGDKDWEKIFRTDTTSYDVGSSVQQTTDSGYVLAGATASDISSGIDAWLIKTDSSGDEEWDQTFGGAGNDSASFVRQTTDGGYVLAGDTTSSGAGGADAWLIKTGSSGDEEWEKTFGGTNIDHAGSVQQTADGSYVLGGYTYSSDTGGCGDAWLVKAGSSGDKEWEKTFGNINIDEAAYSAQQTADGGYVLAGNTESYGAGSDDAWLIKTDSSGKESWNETFGGADHDGAQSVQQTADGGYVLAGWTKSYGSGDYDAWLVKVASEGTAPAVTGITPKTCVQGLSVNITDLAGTGFQTGATVRIEQPKTGKVIDATKVKVVSDTQITCTINLQNKGAPLGKYDVVVRNPDAQEGRLANGFTVVNLCGQGAGAVVLAFGLMLGLLSLSGFDYLRRRLQEKDRN